MKIITLETRRRLNTTVNALVKLFLVACLLLSSLPLMASYLGDTISVSGVPGSSQSSAVIDQSLVEITAGSAGGGGISFGCGTQTASSTSPGSGACGFLHLPTPAYLSLDVSEVAGGMHLDVAMLGSFSAFTLSLGGFDATGTSITGVNLLSDSAIGAPLVDGVTAIPIVPSVIISLGSSFVSDVLSLSSTVDSITLDFGAEIYWSSFTVEVLTAAVPIPAAWVFLVCSLLGLRYLKSVSV